MTKEIFPAYVCKDCELKAGGKVFAGTTTLHNATCPICGEEMYHIGYFGNPKFYEKDLK